MLMVQTTDFSTKSDSRDFPLKSSLTLRLPGFPLWTRQAAPHAHLCFSTSYMIPFAHVGFGTQARWLKKGCEIVLGFFLGQVWDSFFDFLAGTICLVFATVWTLNLSFCRVFATFGRSPSILHEISCMWACSPSICMVPHFGMFTFHFAWDLLHAGVFPFHFAWDWLHLGMFTFHFAWGFLHVGVFTFYFAWHGIGCILACSPSILHGICYMWACSPSILYGICYMWACSPSILYGIRYMLACSPHHHANPKGFDTFWHGHLHYIKLSREG